MGDLLTGDELMKLATADEAARELQRLADAGKLTPEVAREVVNFDLIHLAPIPEAKH